MVTVFSPSIAEFMRDPTLRKVGVQIGGDAKKLFRDHQIVPNGLVELSTIARQIDGPHWENRVGLIGLQDQVGRYLKRYLSKDSEVRMGKWGGRLAEDQQICAPLSFCPVFSRVLMAP